MAVAIQAKQIPPRLVQNLGYGLGYPLFNYYAPFPYYLGTAIFLSGFGLILATKLMIAGAFISAGLTMYFAASRIWGVRGGLFAAILYVLSPYHAVQLYVRGSIGELWAYALLPLIILGIVEVYKEKISKKNLSVGMLAVLILSISHTISLFIFALLWSVQFIMGAIFLAICKRDIIRYIKRSLLFVSIPLLLSAYYWIPALSELNLTRVSIESGNDVKYSDHFITLSQLWSSSWGFAGSTKGVASDGMSFMLGKIVIILSFVAILLTLLGKKLFNSHQKLIMYAFSVCLIISTFIMLEQSKFIWGIVPYAQLIQFPWRFIMVSTCFLSLMAPGSLTILSKVSSPLFQKIGFITLVIIVSIYQFFPASFKDFPKTKYFNGNGFYSLTDEQLKSKDHLRFDASKNSDEYLPKNAIKPSSLESTSLDHITCDTICTIANIMLLPHKYSFKVSTSEESLIQIDKTYFPNFKVFVNGSEKEIIIDEPNKMGVKINKGDSLIEYVLENTLIRNIANTISIATLICLLLYTSVVIGKNRVFRGKV